MGKSTICIGENKGADQLRSNCEADQRLCFRYTYSTISLLTKMKFQASSLFLRLYTRFVSDLVGNPKDRFSRVAAHLVSVTLLDDNCFHGNAAFIFNIPRFWNLFPNLSKPSTRHSFLNSFTLTKSILRCF